MENPPARFPARPGGAEVAVALTFDVDGEAPWLSEGPEYARRLTLLSQGLAALGRLGVRPDGYRSPGWELTPQTLDLLGELGFSHDSSLMADDRPYWVTSGARPLLELPGHWSRTGMLESVITAMAGAGRTWFATHAQLAGLAGAPSSGSP